MTSYQKRLMEIRKLQQEKECLIKEKVDLINQKRQAGIYVDYCNLTGTYQIKMMINYFDDCPRILVACGQGDVMIHAISDMLTNGLKAIYKKA